MHFYWVTVYTHVYNEYYICYLSKSHPPTHILGLTHFPRPPPHTPTSHPVTFTHNSLTHSQTPPHTHTHTPTCPGIQSEDTIYTRVYSVFVQAFKARTNLCITHSKWGHFFTHLWTCLARTERGLRPYPPTPILWMSEDNAHNHKARTEILTSLCQNVLTLNVKNWFWSSLWMPGRTHTESPPLHHLPSAQNGYLENAFCCCCCCCCFFVVFVFVFFFKN